MTMPVASGPTSSVYTFTSTAPTELLPVMFADGSSAVVWSGVDTALDPSFTGVFARFFDAAGAPRGGVVKLNTVTTQNQNLPEVALLENGNLLVSWYSDNSAPPPPSGTFSFGGEVVAQIVSPSGALIGGEIVLPAAPYGYETPASGAPARTVTALPGGGFAAAWVDFPGGIASGAGTITVQMRIFGSNGAAVTGDILVDTFGGLTTFDKVDVDTTTDGRIFISYRERIDSSTKQSYGRFYEADGDPIGNAFTIGTAERNAFKSLVEPLSGGRIVYVHELTGQSSYRVVLLNEAGVATSTAVVLGEKGNLGSVVECPDGGFIVTFTDTTLGNGSNNDVLMQVFTSAGALDGAPIPLPGTNAGSDIAGNASPIVGGRMLTAWLSGFDLKAQVFAFPAQPSAGADSLSGGTGNDTIDGLGGNDTIEGLGGNDSLTGSDGSDLLRGGDDDDVLLGGLQNDTLDGGNGNDTLDGGAGSDSMTGGSGLDTASYASDTQPVAANLFGGFAVQNAGQPTFTVDTLIAIENVTGGGGDDFLIGDNIANRLEGLGGADNLWGYGGNDTLIGGDGNDIIVGGDNDDSLESGIGQDWLYGQGGADILRATDATANAFNVLVGGDGNDTLIGGPTGFDYFYGGDGATAGGNDSFVIAANSGVKVMNDFEAGGVNDVVHLVGTPLSSYAQVQAAMSFSGTINGTVLVVDAGTQVWFLGLQPNQLTAGDFIFV